jgi:uncharacterized surface protein with fasciclin (FAS1) repeats
MKSIVIPAVITLSLISLGAQANPMVGGAPMSAEKNIVENASKSNDHTTLVAAVKAAGLVDTLEGNGPFTVFAPTNEAFAELPAGTVDNLLKPENKDQLVKILTYHVVPGRLTGKQLMQQIKDGGGQATLKTVQGGLILKDTQGNTATVTIKNVMQSNGVIHVIDHVLMP